MDRLGDVQQVSESISLEHSMVLPSRKIIIGQWEWFMEPRSRVSGKLKMFTVGLPKKKQLAVYECQRLGLNLDKQTWILETDKKLRFDGE
ncbi:hypothetical protein PsorP6_015536 [Peronosclerospora sorghi]|uniref:Uncharacterized protein n=1 Tax=Peronosclerospora sorghi TaxID=230839 RepID=A0ACC0WP56_9STRA|nr:hypothetical protein PsorP6_015536 [Peronosclerospora sorghi]